MNIKTFFNNISPFIKRGLGGFFILFCLFFNFTFAQELVGTCKPVSTFTREETESGVLKIYYRGKNNIPYGASASARPRPFQMLVTHYPHSTCTIENAVSQSHGYQCRGNTCGYFGYHFYVGQDGRIFQAAPMTKRTNHTDSTRSRGTVYYDNNSSIGITLVCGERGTTNLQVQAAIKLGHVLQVAYNIPSFKIFGHGELQGNRESREGSPLHQSLRRQIPSTGKFTINYALENGQLGECEIDGPVPAGCSGDLCNVSIPATGSGGPLGNLLSGMGLGGRPLYNDSNDPTMAPILQDQPLLKNLQQQPTAISANQDPNKKQGMGIVGDEKIGGALGNGLGKGLGNTDTCSESFITEKKLRVKYYYGNYKDKFEKKYGDWEKLLEKGDTKFDLNLFLATFYAKQIKSNLLEIQKCVTKSPEK